VYVLISIVASAIDNVITELDRYPKVEFDQEQDKGIKIAVVGRPMLASRR